MENYQDKKSKNYNLAKEAVNQLGCLILTKEKGNLGKLEFASTNDGIKLNPNRD